MNWELPVSYGLPGRIIWREPVNRPISAEPVGPEGAVAEQINAESGLGYVINNARDFLRLDTIIFGLVIYALMGISTDGIVRILEKRALRYRLDA